MATHFNPTCWICNKAVTLEGCRIDEYGKGVHAECYVAKLAHPKAEPTRATDERWRGWCALDVQEPAPRILVAIVQEMSQVLEQIKYLQQLGKAPSDRN